MVDEHLELLRERILEFSSLQLAAIAGSIAERLLPNFHAFCVDVERPELFDSPKRALQHVWHALETSSIDAAKTRDFVNQLEAIGPDADDFVSEYIADAQYASAAIVATLNSLLTGDPKFVTVAAHNALISLSGFLEAVALPLMVSGKDDYGSWIDQAPLLRVEVLKQLGDAELLRASVISEDLILRIRKGNDRLGIQPFDREFVSPKVRGYSTGTTHRTAFQEYGRSTDVDNSY